MSKAKILVGNQHYASQMHMYLRHLGILCDCRWLRNITGNFNYSVVMLSFFKFKFEWFSVPWDWGILLLRLPSTSIVLIIFNHSSILFHCPSPWPLVCLSWNIVRNATHLYKPEVVWDLHFLTLFWSSDDILPHLL